MQDWGILCDLTHSSSFCLFPVCTLPDRLPWGGPEDSAVEERGSVVNE